MTDTHRIEIQVDSTSAGRATVELRLLTGSVNNAERSIGALGSSMKMLGGAIGGLSFGMLANSIFKVNVEMQALRTTLETATGSANNARIAFEGIQKFAKETPYSVKEVTDAFIKLKNLGLSPTESNLKSFGNTASAMGKSLNQMIEAVADAATMEFERLKEFGIKSSHEGDKVKFTFKGVETTVKDSAQEIEKYLLKIGNTDFSGGMERMANTMKGSLSNLGDSWDAFQDHLLNSNKENAIAKWMQTAADSIGKFDVWLNGASTTIGKIQELQKQNASLQKGVNANKNNGMIGSMIDDLVGYDPSLNQSKIDANNKLIEQLRKQLTEEEKIKNDITKSVGVKGITPDIKNTIESIAQKRNVDAALIEAIISQETGGTFKQSLTSPKGAVGLMQIMPVAAKQFGANYEDVKKDTVKNIDVGTQAIIRALHQSKGDITEALARYNWGEGNVNKSIAKNFGVFDINKAPKETRDYVESILKMYKSTGGGSSDKGMAEFYKEQEQASKKALSEQESAAKKLASEQEKAAKHQQSLIDKFKDKDPLEKYLADMKELNSVQKSLNPETFLTNQKRIASEFEKSTVDLNAYNQELAKHKKLLDSASDYNSTIDELTRNKQRGAITQGEYGLGVATANAGLMNQVSDKQIPVKNAGEVIDAQNTLESEKALTKLNEEATKTIDSFNQIGNSGKMAFDGILGGISAVASAASNFSDVMTKLNDSHNEYAKNYQAFIEDTTKSEEDKANAKISYEKENDKYQSASFAAEISGARQVAGAASKMFGEKSAARKAFHTIEVTLSIIEMAISAKKMAMNLVETIAGIQAGAAQFFAQSGWAGFAGVAAMMAVMAGLGFAASSGGSSTIGAIPEYTKTTGGVLGDSEAQSKSVQNVSEKLDEIHAREYPELKNISSSMENFVKSIDKMLINVLRSGIDLLSVDTRAIIGGLGSKMLNFMALGLGGLLFGKTTKSVVGGGIRINEQSVADLQAGKEFDAQVSTIIQTTKKSLFGSSTRITEMFSGLDKSIGDGLSNVIVSMAKNVASFWEYLGLDMKKGLDAIGSFSFSAYIKTFGLKDTEITDALKNWTSMTYDQMITHVLGGFVKQFQAMGESIGDTLGRLVVDANSVKSSMRNAGLQTKLTGEDFVIFSQQMLDATGGLKNFIASMDTLISKFISKDVKADISASNILDTLKTKKVIDAAQSLNVDLTPFTNFANDVKNNIPKTAEQISDMSVRAMKVVDDIDTKFQDLSLSNNKLQKEDYTTAKEQAFNYSQNITQKEQTAVDNLNSHSSGLWKFNKSTTTEDASAQAKAAGLSAKFFDTYLSGTLKSYLSRNSATKAKGESELTAMGLPLDLLQLQEMERSASAAVDPAKELVGAITNISTSTANTAQKLEDDGKRIGASYESILKKITTQDETLIRNQKTVVDSLSDKLVSSGDALVDSKVIEWLKSIGETAVITEKTLQRFNDSLLYTAKTAKALADASKYLDNFSHSIKTWVQNMKATQLGSPESQLSASSKNFAEQMQIIKGGLAYSGEEKQAALSGIMSVADTYIQSLKNYYGSGIEAQAKIQEVVDGVSGLGNIVDVASLQLGVLQQIREGVNTLPTGITAGLETTFFTNLATAINTAQKNYQTAPTAQNDLIANTLAKEWTLAVSAVSKGNGFLDAFISSFDGDTGLNTAVKLIFDNKTIDSVQAQTVIDKTLNALDTSKLNVKGDKLLLPNFSTRAQTAIDTEVAKLKIEPLKLDANAKPVGTTIDGLFSGGNLTGFNDKSYIATLDVNKQAVNDGIDATTPLLTDFSKINAVATIGLNGASATVESFDIITTAAQRTQDAMAATSSIQSFAIAENARIAAERQAAIDKQNQDAAIALYKANANKRIAQNAVDKAAGLVTLDAKYKTDLGSSGILSKSKIEASDISLLTTLAQNALLSANKSIAGITESSMQSMKYVNGALSANFNTGGAFAQSINIVDAPKVHDKISTANAFPKFAKGGIANQASIFGEAGAEAAVPLPDGRSIPVSFNRPSANDSSTDNKETIEELKAQNRQLSATLEVLQAGFNQLLEESKKQTESLDGIERKARLRKAA